MAPTLPECIRVERDPGWGVVRLLIDGVEFPHYFSIDPTNPLSVDLTSENGPGVRLTLLAQTVEVSDRLLVDVDIDEHEHDE